jgi:ADP-ribose pyrophosphatase YjhB (NUDIX family)
MMSIIDILPSIKARRDEIVIKQVIIHLMDKNRIHIRVRLIVIHNKKLLVQYRKKGDYYHYIGGHLEYGETIKEACIREVKEECNGTNFKFKKILYVRDFVKLKEGEHSVELFILGDLDKYDGLDNHLDPQHTDGSVWLTWLNIDKLPGNLLPKTLSSKLLKAYKNGFTKEGEYIGEID